MGNVIALLSSVDPRRARVHVIADVRFCASLSRAGNEVSWIVPAMGPTSRIDAPALLRGLAPPHPFRLRLVPTTRRRGPRDLGHLGPLILGARWLTRDATVVISRDLRLLGSLALTRRRGQRLIVWMHEYRDEPWERAIVRRLDAVIATNSAIVEDVRMVASELPALVVGNPVPAERIRFAAEVKRTEARSRLQLAADKSLVVYTGKLYPEMAELGHILDAASAMPGVDFLLTGGQPRSVLMIETELRRRGLANVRLTGFLKAADDARLYQQAADVLVSYYTDREHPTPRHNLPNKLDEYLATGNPVVVADFAAVRDFVDDDSAFLVPPDDSGAFIQTLERVLADPRGAEARGRRAQMAVGQRTYEAVGAQISDFLSEVNGGGPR